MDRIGKILGILSLVLAILSTPASMISGVGIIGALLSLVFAGVAAALLSIKLAAISFVVTTINIFGLSVVEIPADLEKWQMQMTLGIPYSLFLLGLLTGVFRSNGAKLKNDL